MKFNQGLSSCSGETVWRAACVYYAVLSFSHRTCKRAGASKHAADQFSFGKDPEIIPFNLCFNKQQLGRLKRPGLDI